MSTIKEILEDRQNTHGELMKQALICQCIKDVMRITDNWKTLKADQKECLEMIAHKTARILAGDANHLDHWDDIAGYALLVAHRLK